MFWHAAGWVRRPGGEAEMPVGRFPGLVVRWGALTSVEIYIRDLELEVGRGCTGRRYGLRANIYISHQVAGAVSASTRLHQSRDPENNISGMLPTGPPTYPTVTWFGALSRSSGLVGKPTELNLEDSWWIFKDGDSPLT